MAARCGESEIFFSAGKGGKVRRWGAMLRPLGTIDVREPLAALTDGWGRPLVFRGGAPCVRSLTRSSGILMAGSVAGWLAGGWLAGWLAGLPESTLRTTQQMATQHSTTAASAIQPTLLLLCTP